MKQVKTTIYKKIFFILGLIFVAQFYLFGDDWVLSAQEFAFVQPGNKAQSEKKAATVIPQLILELIAQDKTRSVSTNELLDRKLNELQTERLSLFLQLSKEYKTRDALVLSKKTSRELSKSIVEQEKKIAEIEEKIQTNLKSVEEITIEYKDANKKNTNERVILYKNDASQLFMPSKEASQDGLKSWIFSKEVLNAKINGLLVGSITSYGEYASVTVELFVFPYCKSMGVVTEVGLLSDTLSIARRLVRLLSPKIANSLPVTLRFDIGPVNAREKCTINIDGVVYPNYKEGVMLDAGIHNVTIESESFSSVSFNYMFSGEQQYVIKTDLQSVSKGVFNIKLKKHQDGIFYSRALEQSIVNEENPSANLTLNGKSLIGLYTKYDDDGTLKDRTKNSAFFYIPQSSLFDGAELTVKVKPYNREENIDKRRRWMYTAYSCLICSLPFTFYSVGNSTSINNAYTSGNTGITYDEVQKWQNFSYVTIGITSVFGVWTAFEIYRYLKAANEVLPATAY